MILCWFDSLKDQINEPRMVIYTMIAGFTVKSPKRKLVTLLSFLMAISLYASVFIFIDSYSYPMWEKYNDIGSVAMRVQGDGLEQALNEIASTKYVTGVGLAKKAHAFLRMDMNDVYIGSPTDPLDPIFLVEGSAYSLSSNFSNDFPDEFKIVSGRFPQNSSEIAISFRDAQYWGIPIGRMMNYTHTLNGIKRTVFVVGIFRLSSRDAIRYTITDAIAVVTPDVLNANNTAALAYVNIDRTIVTPINPRASLSLLHEIENTISSINPTHTPYFKFYVDNYLALGIQSYIDKINLDRTKQVSRLQILFLLSGMMVFLGVRFNVNLREDATDYQRMRGASKSRILWVNMSELCSLSIFAGMCSVFVGLLLSRVGWLSTNYLEFNSKTSSNPILVSVDTLIIIGFSSLIMPFMGYVANNATKQGTKVSFEHKRLARLVRSFHLIRWDVTVYMLVSILILSLYFGTKSISQNPVLILMASLVSMPLFLAVSSLFNKGLTVLSRLLSRIFTPIIGKIPSSAGMRSISNNDSLAVPTVIILAIVLSSFLASNTLATSLPSTHLAQTRYLIGGDLSFRLDNDASADWGNFSNAVCNDENVTAVAFVSMGYLSLSEGPQGATEFVAVKPKLYSQVGYSYSGEGLDSSSQNKLLEELEANPEGAILTEDVASEYDLIPGDTLHVFSVAGESLTVEFNIIGITDMIPRPRIIGEASSDAVLGMRKIWLNLEYVGGLIDLNASANTYLCVRTSDTCNTTEIGERMSAEYATVVYGTDQWSSATAELKAFQSGEEYTFDRSLDSMITISMILSMLMIFAIFQINKQNIDKRNNTILKTLGASQGLLLKIRLGEILSLVVISLLFVFFISPINVSNILRMGLLEYNTWTYTFPIAVFVNINWSAFFVVDMVLLIPSTVLILALSTSGHDSSIGRALGESETGSLTRRNMEVA
jgi:hypothetical protein